MNIIVLWNTLDINAALEQLQAERYPVQSEDVARLSPLVFEHINLLGRYAFAVPDSVLRGELRPLRNPADSIEDVPRKSHSGEAYFLNPVFPSVNPQHPKTVNMIRKGQVRWLAQGDIAGQVAFVTRLFDLTLSA